MLELSIETLLVTQQNVESGCKTLQVVIHPRDVIRPIQVQRHYLSYQGHLELESSSELSLHLRLFDSKLYSMEKYVSLSQSLNSSLSI